MYLLWIWKDASVHSTNWRLDGFIWMTKQIDCEHILWDSNRLRTEVFYQRSYDLWHQFYKRQFDKNSLMLSFLYSNDKILVIETTVRLRHPSALFFFVLLLLETAVLHCITNLHSCFLVHVVPEYASWPIEPCVPFPSFQTLDSFPLHTWDNPCSLD